MRKDHIRPIEARREHGHWLLVVSRIVSGVVCVAGFVWAVRYFEGNEFMLSVIIMILPMAMIWYPKEIDNFTKGGYGEGGASQFVIAVFGWMCLLLFLVLVGLRVAGYW